MKLGVMSPVLGGMSLRQMIEYLSSLGVQSLELGCGGYPGKAHCDAADFLAHPEKIEELKQMLAENHMDLPALAATAILCIRTRRLQGVLKAILTTPFCWPRSWA